MDSQTKGWRAKQVQWPWGTGVVGFGLLRGTQHAFPSDFWLYFCITQCLASPML